MTTFGENERGLQKHYASRHVPAKNRQEETVPGALGLPRKMHLSFKKEKQQLVSAAGTTENPSRSCGTTAQAFSEGGQQAVMDQSQKRNQVRETCVQEPTPGFLLLRGLNRTSKCKN